MERLEAMMQAMTPSIVMVIVALVGLIVLAIALLAFLILAVNRRAAAAAEIEGSLGEAEAALVAEAEARAAAEARAGALAAERDAALAEREAVSGVLDRVVAAVDGMEEVWTRRPFEPPADYAARLAESIPVIACANLKGGVGKTTLSANLAAWFDARGERVLLIDLDYQGSLSAMAVADPTRRDWAAPGASAMLRGAWPAVHPMAGARSNSEVADSYYALLNEENRLLFGWLLGTVAEDVRYRLASLVLSPRVQTVYDRIVIDTPPRLTLGFVNALAAATHIIVPTQLNGLSIEAAQSFLATLDAMRPAPLLPDRPLRIVGMQKTWSTERLSQVEIEGIAEIERLLARRGEPPGTFLRDAILPNMSGFARVAGRGLAYQLEPSVRRDLDRLGERVAAFAPSYAEEPEE